MGSTAMEGSELTGSRSGLAWDCHESGGCSDPSDNHAQLAQLSLPRSSPRASRGHSLHDYVRGHTSDDSSQEHEIAV